MLIFKLKYTDMKGLEKSGFSGLNQSDHQIHVVSQHLVSLSLGPQLATRVPPAPSAAPGRQVTYTDIYFLLATKPFS